MVVESEVIAENAPDLPRPEKAALQLAFGIHL